MQGAVCIWERAAPRMRHAVCSREHAAPRVQHVACGVHAPGDRHRCHQACPCACMRAGEAVPRSTARTRTLFRLMSEVV
eukprot:324463-Chlamydomonas_euryale.AAC.3